MALRVEKRGDNVMRTTDPARPPLCHTCKQRKRGLFTIDVYGNPQCADCAREAGRPIGG